MVFSTLTFLYLFFPITVMLYFAVPGIRMKNAVLLLVSLVFYAWGEPIFVLLMLFAVFVNYICGRAIGASRGPKSKKAYLVIAIAANLALLGLFKYAGFIIDNLNGIFSLKLPGWKLGLPIGISFYTFQAMTYTIDTYRGDTPAQKSYAKLLLYVSLFPQLIAGPIVRYSDICREIDERQVTVRGFSHGITRFLCGLGKKLLLANYCGAACAPLLASGADSTVLGGWLGIVLYAFQIYFDFSGYSDMAIGLGQMLGFHFKENFNYPYIANSITDFWRRWHISLSTFFRDYVYIPLGGNRRKQIRNLLVVWLLTGLWHGAAWNFVLWGLYFGVLLILEKFVFKKLLDKLPDFITRLSTFFFVLMGWVLFYFTDLTAIGTFLSRIFGGGGYAFSDHITLSVLTNNSLLLLACIIASTPIGKVFRGIALSMEKEGGWLENTAMLTNLLFNIALLAVCTIVMATNTFNPFLYFRF